jgi:hypothetical protein
MAAKILLVEAEEQSGFTPRLHPAGGFKPCFKLGLHHAFKTPDGVACPGCNRLCELPKDFVHGQPFMIVKRPSIKGR